jgi:hypothetical protein
LPAPTSGEAAPLDRGEPGRPILYLDHSVGSEAAGHVPEAAKQLIVHVIGYFNDGKIEKLGAGIVFGIDEGRVYIATADHVLRHQGQVADEVRVAFRGQSQELIAADRDTAHAQLDLAVVAVARRFIKAFDSRSLAFDRRGAVEALKSGDPVTPIGCPNGECWAPATTPDRVFAGGRFSISFESVSITTGHSGGGLFNEWWELVGMITDREGQIARADAIPINTLLETVAGWGYPVDLRKPVLPRGGYCRSVGVLSLAAAQSIGDAIPDGRFPGGRATYTQNLMQFVSWHAGVLRLTPANLSVTAGVVGLGIDLRAGRFMTRPFAEVGYGRLEARFDDGGYFVEEGGRDRYVPNWSLLKSDGLGGGVGVAVAAVVAPRTIFEVVGAYWRFERPDGAPQLPNLALGAGFRLGM